jgi:hypothetical protein
MTAWAMPRGVFARAGWSPQVAMLVFAALACLAVYYRDAVGMASIWWHSSTFGHCLFIPFIIGWMVQQRLPQFCPNCASWKLSTGGRA